MNMKIEKERIGKTTIVLRVFGRLDTANAPLLDLEIKQWGGDITELILDFAGLDYISSMGLRILLQAKKTLKDEGCNFFIKNMNASIREVFELTGFLNLMVNEEKFNVIRNDDPSGITLFLNGQLEAENVPKVSKELAGKKTKNANVIIDMKNLSFISPEAVKLLKKAIADTAGEGRTLTMQNVSVDLREEIGELGN